MAIRRSRRRAQSDTELSMDSLIDVFMNILGVLMITAVVMALALPTTKTRSEASKKNTSVPATHAETNQDQVAELRLPRVEKANTKALYFFLSKDGVREFSVGDTENSGRYFNETELSDSTRLSPIPGRVMGIDEISASLDRYSPLERHMTAVITSDGIGYYKEIRALGQAKGFRVGWMQHQTDYIDIGSNGRTGDLVQ